MTMTMTEWLKKYRPEGLSTTESSNLKTMYGTSEPKELDVVAKTRNPYAVSDPTREYTPGTIKDSSREELLKSISSAKSVGVEPVNEIKELESRPVEAVDTIEKAPLTMPTLPEAPIDVAETVPESNVLKNSDLINALYDARSQSMMAGLDKTKALQESALAKEKAEIEPMYRDMRTQADVRSMQNAKRLSDVMKASGYDVGTQTSTMLAENVSGQQAQTDIRMGEAKAKEDIARRGTDIETAYAYDLLSAQTGLEADKLQSLIEQARHDEEVAIQKQQFDEKMALERANITGFYEGLPTMKRQQLEADLKGVEQRYELGELTLENAQWEIDELMNPDSYTNRLKDIELKTQEINLEYLPKEYKAKLKEMQDRISRLNSTPEMSDHEKRLMEIEVEKAEIELDDMKNEVISAPGNLNNLDFHIDAVDDLVESIPEPSENTRTEIDRYNNEKNSVVDDYFRNLQKLGADDQTIIDFAMRYNIPITYIPERPDRHEIGDLANIDWFNKD